MQKSQPSVSNRDLYRQAPCPHTNTLVICDCAWVMGLPYNTGGVSGAPNLAGLNGVCVGAPGSGINGVSNIVEVNQYEVMTGPQSRPSIMANVANVAIPRPLIAVNIIISAKTQLHYLNPFGGDAQKLILLDDFGYSIPHGTEILIRENNFAIVSHFCPNIGNLMELTREVKQRQNKKLVLPVGTRVIQNNGIPVALAADLEVILPPNCSIKLPAQTKLQIPIILPAENINDPAVEMILHSATQARMI